MIFKSIDNTVYLETLSFSKHKRQELSCARQNDHHTMVLSLVTRAVKYLKLYHDCFS